MRTRSHLFAVPFVLLVTVSLADAAHARSDGIPLQFDVSVGAMYGNAASPPEGTIPIGTGSLWVGLGLPPFDYRTETDHDGRGFFASGVEGTIDGSRGPYQWSIGTGPRMGWRWRVPGGPAGPFPDGYVYGRVTPFLGFRSVADEEYLGEEPRVSVMGWGTRLGIGFTVAGWPATTLPALSHLDFGTFPSGGSNDPCAAVMGAILIALLIDHGELTYEIYRSPGEPLEHRAGWRVGIGF